MLHAPVPEFDTISEVIPYVEDVDRTTSFYGDVFGLDVAAGDPGHGFVKFDTGECALCLHAGRDGDLGKDVPTFVFEVEDLDEPRSHLERHDVELGDGRSPPPGSRVCDGLDPEGNKFSIEPPTTPE